MATEAQETVVNIDTVIKTYITLRDRLDELKQEHKAQLAPINAKMEKIEGWLQNQLQTQGLQNFKGASGVAFLKNVTQATVADWDATLPFIIEHELWALLERRVSKSVVEDYVETHGEVPPGVNYEKSIVVQVRRG